MAQIYIARSTGIGSFERHVVLKLILPERAHDETSVQMFLDEARLAASLNHQNVAQVFEVGKEAGIHFLAMEYVHGQDLRALLAKAGSSGTRVPLELALTVVAGAAAGLEHAHERRTSDGTPMGIVHRDVSPSNIMIGYDGAVKLLDFGIAKATSRSIQTQSGIIKGKFAYMAPEQCRGRDVDRRSDVFSLGIILYEVTTQHRCFRADSDFDTMHRIVTGDVVRPTRLVQSYPQALEAIVLKALAVDPAQRYQSAALLLEALEDYAGAARMPLSTTSLGRFMRDMFGDVQEPWLASGRLGDPGPVREHTISSTNASGDQGQARPPSSPSIQRPPLASQPSVAPPGQRSSSSPALPRAPSAGAAASPGQRSSSSSLSSPALQHPPSASSPAAQRLSLSSLSSPAFQRSSPSAAPSPVAPPIDQALELPPLHAEAPLHLPPDAPLDLAPQAMDSSYPAFAPQAAPYAVMPPATLGAALATQHFAEQVPSGSGAAHSAMPQGTQPIARTRQGYANAPTLSRSDLYPRFEAPELESNVSLQPGNRLLYIGLGIALVGIIVLLAISILSNNGSEEPPATPAQPTRTQSSQSGIEARPDRSHDVATGAPVVTAVKPEAVRIRLHVTSIPSSAEVSLGGKPLGITPLTTEIESRLSTDVLTIHRPRYQDVTATIDLAHDFEQTVTLVPLPEPAPPRTPPEVKSTPRDHPVRDGKHPAQGAQPSTKDLDCQPRDRINPFEKACHGHVCQPCPGSTP